MPIWKFSWLWDFIKGKLETIGAKNRLYDPDLDGKISDAQLKDVDWSKILNKPSTYPPSAHQHDASEITSGILTRPFSISAGDCFIKYGLCIGGTSRRTSESCLELYGGTSSAILSVQDGNGRIQLKWNASRGINETFLVGGEHAAMWEFDPANPTTDLFRIKYANGSAAAAGDPITWTDILKCGTNGLKLEVPLILQDGSKITSAYDAGGITYSTPTVYLGNGESLQLARFTLPAGKSFKVLKAQVAKSDGSSASDLVIEVYDATNGTTVYSTSSATVVEGSPLATSNAGVEIIIRIKNSTGAAVECQGFVVGVMS